MASLVVSDIPVFGVVSNQRKDGGARTTNLSLSPFQDVLFQEVFLTSPNISSPVAASTGGGTIDSPGGWSRVPCRVDSLLQHHNAGTHFSETARKLIISKFNLLDPSILI